MSDSKTEDFALFLIKALAEKLSFEEDEKAEVDQFRYYLVTLSEAYHIKTEIYGLPSELITRRASFYFLHVVSSDICAIEESTEKRFFVLCAFAMNIIILSIEMPCQRLMYDLKCVLDLRLQGNLVLNMEPDKKTSFLSLVSEGNELAKDKPWIECKYNQLRKFIRKLGTGKEPTVECWINSVRDAKTCLSTKSAKMCGYVACPFCDMNCKKLFEAF